ncbi:MAG: helix-turn-helix transcriptional regulator [Candidatus Eremiobacteraeota bacterium]|nr:helix-turn-helix transcriptional regulator [Candidatus Eremiobacteraeota bacterium]
MDAAVRAIALDRRRDILSLVATQELSAGAIAAHFDVTRPAISQHLSVLKDAGLVAERREGTKRLYSARPQGLAQLRAFLETFWDARLRRLQRAAEASERSTRHAIRRNRRRRPRDQDQRKT